MENEKVNTTVRQKKSKKTTRHDGELTNRELLAILHDHLNVMKNAGFDVSYIKMVGTAAFLLELPKHKLSASKGMIILDGEPVE